MYIDTHTNIVNHGFGPRSCQTKHYNIDICCFSTKLTSLRRKSKDWLARNRDNVSKWNDKECCFSEHPL